MGYGIYLKTEIGFRGITKSQIECKFEENLDVINMLEKELFMLISARPNDIVSEDAKRDGSVVEELRIKADQLLESYRDCLRENFLLSYFKDADINEIEEG